jgi:hypothetical protein
VATGGELNHAALIVDTSGGLIEANPCVLAGQGALRRAHIADYLAAGRLCWVGYVELQEGTRESVVDFVERVFGAQRGLSELGALMLALQVLLGIAPRARTARHAWLRPLHAAIEQHALVMREEHTYLSGELVARALEHGGFVWNCDPAYVTPAELFARFHLRDESDGGVLIPLAAARLGRRGARPGRPTGPAVVSAFTARAPRPLAGAAAGVALRAEVPPPVEAAMPEGLRAVAQVALLALGTLTVAHGIEALLQHLQPDG